MSNNKLDKNLANREKQDKYERDKSFRDAKNNIGVKSMQFVANFFGPFLFCLILFCIGLSIYIWYKGSSGDYQIMLSDLIYIFKNFPHFLSEMQRVVGIAVGFIIGIKYAKNIN